MIHSSTTITGDEDIGDKKGGKVKGKRQSTNKNVTVLTLVM